MKTKIFRNLISKLMTGALMAAFVLCFGQNVINAQVAEDLSPQVLNELQEMINMQEALLAKEIEMEPSNESLVESNKRLIHYFGSAFRAFRQDGIDIQEAFAWNLSAIAPPRHNDRLANNLFDESGGSFSGQGNLSEITPAFRMAGSELQQAIISINLSEGGLDSIENFIDLINANRY